MIRGRESEPEGDQCFNFTPYIRQGEYDREEVISEGYDPDHSPFGTPVYWRIVNRGDQQFYCGEIRPGFECVPTANQACRHHPHIVLRLRHVFLCGGFLRKGPLPSIQASSIATIQRRAG
jgi:hypothetical protein